MAEGWEERQVKGWGAGGSVTEKPRRLSHCCPRLTIYKTSSGQLHLLLLVVGQILATSTILSPEHLWASLQPPAF